MSTLWNSITDDVQHYIATGITPLIFVYEQFLEALLEKEKAQLLCLLPAPRFEVFHIRLEHKVRARLKRKRSKAA